MSEHDIEDDVVQEGTSDLFLLQYPLKPDTSWGHVDDIAPLREAKLKPSQHKWEITRGLDTTASYYNKSKGEQIASAAKISSLTKDGTSPFSGETRMDSQKYVSSNASGLCANANAIVTVQDGTLFMHPIKAILQMRPTFDYADAADDARKTSIGGAVAGVAGESDKSGHEDSEQEAARPVTVRFAKEETENMKKRREASFRYQEKLKAEERWVSLTPHGPHDPESISKRQSLSYASGDACNSFSLLCEPDVYLRLLAPKPLEQKQEVPKLPTNTVSLADLRQLPIPEQIRSLMLNVKAIRIRQLLALLPPGIDESVVLKHLQQYAVLVRGCWVVKSNILYPDDSKSPKTGVAGSLLCKVRDIILYKFLQSPLLVRKQILDMVKIPSDDLSDIFSQVAKFRMQKGWAFIYQQDDDFIERHKDIFERQSHLWETRFHQIVQTLSQSRTRRVSAAGRVRRRTGSKSFSMSSDDDNLPGFSERGHPHQRKRTASGRRSESSSTVAIESTISSIASGKMEPPAAVAQQPESTSTRHHDTGKQLDLVAFLREQFNKCPVQSLSDIRRFFLLSLADDSAGKSIETYKEPDNTLVEQCACNILQAEKILTTAANPDEQTLYVATALEPWPLVRKLLVDTLKQQRRLKFTEFKEICTQEFQGKRPNDTELRKLLKAYCTQKNGLYSLHKT